MARKKAIEPEKNLQQAVQIGWFQKDQGGQDWNRTLFDILQDWRARRYEAAPHQRDFIWTREKMMGLVRRLMSGRRLVGVMVTYAIPDFSQQFVNDGKQRITTIDRVTDYPDAWGCHPDDWEKMLRRTNMYVQERNYASYKEALEDFQYLNRGTSLTPYEFFRGEVAYLTGHDRGNTPEWEAFFSSGVNTRGLHSFIFPMLRDVLSASGQAQLNSQENRAPMHAWRRDDYAMFLRLAGNSISGQDAWRDFSDVSKRDYEKITNPVEVELNTWLQAKGIIKAQAMRDGLISLLDDTVQIIKRAWSQVGQSEKTGGISPAVARFLLHLSICCENTGYRAQYKDWVVDFLTETKGQNTLVDGRGLRPIRLGELITPYLLIKEQFKIEIGRPKRVKPAKTLHPRLGEEVSHVVPGGDDVVLEPGSLNRRRTSRAMRRDEIEFADAGVDDDGETEQGLV